MEAFESDTLPGPLEVIFAVLACMNGAILEEDIALPMPKVIAAPDILGEWN